MAGSITTKGCPQCKNVGGLRVTVEFVVAHMGSWSLARSQIKTPARATPVLKCNSCTLRLVGTFDGDHAVFNPEAISTP